MKPRDFGFTAALLAILTIAMAGVGLAGSDATPAVAQIYTGTPSPSATTATSTTTTATTTTTTATTTTSTATATRTNTTVPPTATNTTVPPASAATQPTNAPINLTLSGANEVPPVTSTGTGTFRATAGTNSLSYTLTAGGTATGITMAHIHSGAAGVNGPIVAFLITTNNAGVASINQSGTITQADLQGPMAGNMTAFMDALKAGSLYVNVHTIANPGGELRAQIPGTPGPPSTGSSQAADSDVNSPVLFLAAALTGIGALAFGAASLGRKRR